MHTICSNGRECPDVAQICFDPCDRFAKAPVTVKRHPLKLAWTSAVNASGPVARVRRSLRVLRFSSGTDPRTTKVRRSEFVWPDWLLRLYRGCFDCYRKGASIHASNSILHRQGRLSCRDTFHAGAPFLQVRLLLLVAITFVFCYLAYSNKNQRQVQSSKQRQQKRTENKGKCSRKTKATQSKKKRGKCDQV